MKITETTAAEYKEVFKRTQHIYNSVEFSELNKYKVEKLHYLFFEDTKIRFGIVLGENADNLLSPFSAPFGGLCFNRPQNIEFIDEAVQQLKSFGEEHHKKTIITLPPTIYEQCQTAQCINSLSRAGKISYNEINYHFNIPYFHNYESIIERNAKKNLHKALKEEFTFTHVCNDNTEDIIRAYNVIKANREEHGYPLRMSVENVLNTIKIIPADFFILTHSGCDVAAAQIFHVADGICQVIYWGDLRQYNSIRPMNYLAYRIFEHYYKEGIRILDIGPSTEHGIPNYGLCNFKESIGCSVSSRFTFEL